MARVEIAALSVETPHPALSPEGGEGEKFEMSPITLIGLAAAFCTTAAFLPTAYLCPNTPAPT